MVFFPGLTISSLQDFMYSSSWIISSASRREVLLMVFLMPSWPIALCCFAPIPYNEASLDGLHIFSKRQLYSMEHTYTTEASPTRRYCICHRALQSQKTSNLPCACDTFECLPYTIKTSSFLVKYISPSFYFINMKMILPGFTLKAEHNLRPCAPGPS